MHSHHQGSGSEAVDLFVAKGVVGTRDMGADADFILPLRERIVRARCLALRSFYRGQCWTTLPTDFPTADQQRTRQTPESPCGS